MIIMVCLHSEAKHVDYGIARGYRIGPTPMNANHPVKVLVQSAGRPEMQVYNASKT